MVARFDYSGYEFELRDRQWNRELLAGHVSHFQGCNKVFDLACGSGIFLSRCVSITPNCWRPSASTPDFR